MTQKSFRPAPHEVESPSAARAPRPSLAGHLRIARVDHWIKNVFVLPGIVVAASMDRSVLNSGLAVRIAIGLLSLCLMSSSNYVINEILDAPFDRYHPSKSNRPVPSGQVSVRLGYVEWLALMAGATGLGLILSPPFTFSVLALWIMGCVYNISPIRTKDIPYLDVLSESINNPIRMLAGWYLTGTKLVPSASLLASYWMIGCYFMAVKRFSEYRDLDDPETVRSYRKSFSAYTEPRLLVSIVFYSSIAMLFLGAFIIRYRMELILAFPLVALVMAMYLALAFKHDSPVQHPEGLYRDPKLMAAVIACAALMVVLLFVDVPLLHRIFVPTLPTP
ncbi:MAG TPA: UbiA prenyltransferase family protein [Blastocatellia bacterium]|nr:UbiA prenyltransferase family protein [Blastocatellia bacterium]